MPRQTAAVEVNAFVKGLVTEASPLTFPDNASLDEMNMVLNKDGSRRRRLGMNYEEGAVKFNSFQTSGEQIAFSSFVWKSPGGYSSKEFLVIQSGNVIRILDSTIKPISASGVAVFTIGTSPKQRMSMSSVDGLLIVASGSATIYSFDYNGSTVTQSTGRLKIRDLFGVADSLNGTDLINGSGVTLRPVSLTPNHIYNLRNQTFAVPRYNAENEVLTDPISAFRERHEQAVGGTKYPSNADNVVTYLYSYANDSNDRNSKRYMARDAALNPLGTNRAPLGYFIIDALSRGESRMTEAAQLASQYPQLYHMVASLPQDLTPGGATVVASYAGRVWYGGFSSQIVGGDSQSPRMTSYILFSRLVKSSNDVYTCYQQGDPTSAEIPDLVDTDGGFIRLDGAYNVQYMVNVGEALMVVAENGVWKVTGGSGYGFNATNYLTSKITEHGCVSPGSVVLVDNTFMYWSDDGIYHVNQNQYGDWVASNITSSTIQSLFDNIEYLAKVRCQGSYDSYQRQVRWLYNNFLDSASLTKELVLDVNLTAFYQTEVRPLAGNQFPRPLSIVKVPPFTTTNVSVAVIDRSGNNVVATNGDLVSTIQQSSVSQTSELFYVTADSIAGGNIQLTLSYYRDDGFRDWVSSDGVGIDAPAYLLTGWTGGGDYQRQKQVPYITVYSVKTETGFDDDLNPERASSVIVQGQWNWTNLASAGKWTNKFQAYRHARVWMPSGIGSKFDDGEHVVVTKNKLRGRGRVLSLLFETEPGKDFYLLGWSYLISVNGNV
jgi:hypothetical protein